ncbi:hypothetical protein JXC34_05025 [Candidatus Woesearchaeota archaeon]|nr:hypothetical protein [Candidatus Woesearchaeota archaeon]
MKQIKQINKALIDAEHVLLSYSRMMKWLLTQDFNHKKKLTIFNSITDNHLEYLNAIRNRFPQPEIINPLDRLFNDVR